MISTQTLSNVAEQRSLRIITGVFFAMLLLACQGETSAQTAAEQVDEAVDTAAEAVKAEANDAAEAVNDVVEEAGEAANDATEAVAEKVVVSPKLPPLDDSKYTALDSPLTVSTGDKIEVTELFWYGCNHCFALERPLKTWKKNMPANAEFVKIPAIFSARWEFHAKAFYTMQALGVLDQASDAFFQRIHVLRKPINSLGQLTEFLADYEQTEEQVESAFNSFAVDANLRNAKLITAKSTATGVPAILVDGKYLTSASQAGSMDGMFTVIDQLVEKAAAER